LEFDVSLDLIAGAAAAADFTGLSVRQIYHLVEENRLPVVRLGRRLYFRRFELDQAFRAIQPFGNFPADSGQPS
jgi:excisionase family DNA binding protein